MSNYTQSVDFSAKDALASGDPNKKVLGSDVDSELALISTAIASKLDTPSTESAKAAIALPGAVGFYATPTADQTAVASGSSTQVTFGTESYDYGADFASSTFTAPATGTYILTATVQTLTALSSGTPAWCFFRKNGATLLAGARESNGGSSICMLNISWVGPLSASDTVDVVFRHQEGSAIDLDAVGSFASMHFSGARLS